MIYIFDIDGTLSDNAHRLHFITGETKDWEGFHNAMGDDTPIWEVITVVRALNAVGHVIIMSTGRMEKGRVVTAEWLRKYRVPMQGLYMRQNSDHREDYVVKSELLDQIIGNNPDQVVGGAFEDRQQMADMYRARGIRVFQVAKGDY